MNWIFFHSLNWILAGYTGSKNPVQTRKKIHFIKLENVKNQVQIDRGYSSSYSTRSKSSRRKTTKTGSKCWVVFIIAKRKTTTYVGKVCKSVCFRKIFFRRLHNWLVAATRYHCGLKLFLEVH